MPDIVEIIKEQHRQVDELLTRAEEGNEDSAALMREVAKLLLPHSEAEESFVYPAIRDLAGEIGDEIKDGAAEHHQVEEMLQNLLRGDEDDPGFDGTIAAIAGELRHHVQEEEQDLLPILAERLDATERAEMGRRFLEATGADMHESTKRELYEKAREQQIPGRSHMNKQELADALSES